jgi:uncharacterized ParB-like nuclease family protein
MNPVQQVPISSIKIDERFQSRIRPCQPTIDEYRAALKLGTDFPPIKVRKQEAEFVLMDGQHRLRAHQAEGRSDISCEIIECSLDEALKIAAGCNAVHGLRRTNADKRRCVEILLSSEQLRQLSDQALANIAFVDRSFVGRVRGSLGIIPSGERSEQIRVVQKEDGTTIRMNVEKIGGIPRALSKVQDQSESEISESDELRELSDLVTQLEQENQSLRDAIAIAQWDATEIEKVDMKERFESLRSEIRLLQIENDSIKRTRDGYQRENAELIRSIKAYKRKLKELTP